MGTNISYSLRIQIWTNKLSSLAFIFMNTISCGRVGVSYVRMSSMLLAGWFFNSPDMLNIRVVFKSNTIVPWLTNAL